MEYMFLKFPHRVNFKHTFLSEKIVDISMDEAEYNIFLAFAVEIKKKMKKKVVDEGVLIAL